MSSEKKLKLVFRQTFGYLWSGSSITNLNETDPLNDNFSIFEDINDFSFNDTSQSPSKQLFHFVMITYKKENNQYIQNFRQEWKQENNPNTNTESGFNDSYLQPDYTTNNWGGLALSSVNNTIIDGSPNNSSWWFAIGAKSSHNGGFPGINNDASQRTELYVYYKDDTEKVNQFQQGMQVYTHLIIEGSLFSNLHVGEIKIFPPSVNPYLLINNFIPCDGRTIKSVHLEGAYDDLIEYLSGSSTSTSVTVPNYNSNYYIIHTNNTSNENYNNPNNNGSQINANHIPEHNHQIKFDTENISSGVTFNSDLDFNINIQTTNANNTQTIKFRDWSTINQSGNSRFDEHDRHTIGGSQGQLLAHQFDVDHSHNLVKGTGNINYQVNLQRNIPYNINNNLYNKDPSVTLINNAFNIFHNTINSNDTIIQSQTMNENNVEYNPKSYGVQYYIRYR